MQKLNQVIALALAAAVSIPASAVINALPQTSAHIASEHPEVVEIKSAGEICTGTIVGPRVVLTAAHCGDLKNSYFRLAGKQYSITYASSQAYLSREHDVAVALTHEDIQTAHYGSIGGGVRHGSTIRLAGFGCTHRGGTSGQLHLGLTKVIGMDADHLLSYSKNGGVLCQGDSGGPAFLRENGRDVLVAINSAGDIQNINLNVRLDSELSRSFLRKVAEKFHVAICGITRRCASSANLIASS